MGGGNIKGLHRQVAKIIFETNQPSYSEQYKVQENILKIIKENILFKLIS